MQNCNLKMGKEDGLYSSSKDYILVMEVITDMSKISSDVFCFYFNGHFSQSLFLCSVQLRSCKFSAMFTHVVTF